MATRDTHDTPHTGVGVLDKAMAVLGAFPRGGVSLSPAEIAERTALPLPTVYRLAQALAEHGLLERDGSRFLLGVALLRLGSLVAEGIDLRRQARPHMRWLADRSDENVELHIRHDVDRIPIEFILSSQGLRPVVDIGAPTSLHAGAGAKTLLAWLPRAEALRLAQASAARLPTPRPLDLATLAAELDQTRAQGWSFSDGEGHAGVASIAAPIFDANGEVVAALLLSAPSARLPARRRARLIPLVAQAAQRVSRDLGYPSYPSGGGAAPDDRTERDERDEREGPRYHAG